MRIEENKEIISRYFHHFSKGEKDLALDLLSDDLRWWILGKPHLYPYGGMKTKADIAEVFDVLDLLLENWLQTSILKMVAEGDCVAVESENIGTTKTGKPYHNTLCYFFVIRDGKITDVREYFDLMHVMDAFAP